jgi:uncharacterized protein YndB with AHSA1/START domain
VTAEQSWQQAAGDSRESLRLSRAPSVRVGMLIRRPVRDVFAAIADPAITTRFWFTKSSGKMVRGAELTWEWEMYGASSSISVTEVDEDSRLRFTWSGYDPRHPTQVEFRFVRQEGDTYVQVTETGFSGDGDTLVQRVIDSTTGFTFLLRSLKAFLEHDIVLRVVADARPAGIEI